MPGDDLRDHAEQFLAAAISHPECRGGTIVSCGDGVATIELDLNVEMPLGMMADGASPNGVRRTEKVRAKLAASYPWSSPSFYLRGDFPRDLPHLQPGSESELPQPCLVDGRLREYFFQFGLVEAGVFHLVHQLVLWLQHAALGSLIDPQQGWEPALRRDLLNDVIINAEACRASVDRRGGYRFLKARFFRSGAKADQLGGKAAALILVSDDQIPLSRRDEELFTWTGKDESGRGNTVCCLIWPEKLPTGAPFVAGSYMPETITTLKGLKRRARDLRCGRSLDAFIELLERSFDGYTLNAPIPLAIVLCARRPFHLMGSLSDIELLPYVGEIRPERGRASLFAGADNEPVAPAMQIDAINPALLRNVSGSPDIVPVAMLGCGSVGSKMALHLARCGIEVTAVSDKSSLLPHNMARHALARRALAVSKADELASELQQLGQSPQSHKGDLVGDLASREARKVIFPRETAYAVNTTASLAVREALAALPAKDLKIRVAEAALFGRGHGGFLLLEGGARNPSLCDLTAKLYAGVKSARTRLLLFDPEHGLTEVQIGQGCSSLTMPMTDMRLSAMTALLTEEFVRLAGQTGADGQVITVTTADVSGETSFTRQSVKPFTVIPVEGPEGWTIRVSQNVIDAMRAEMANYPTVETGGLLIGMSSARLRAVTVVDLLPAPPDSVRSASEFVLGTEGLGAAIKSRHIESGQTLFDVGTWHSHLADQGASARDRLTAKELAAERPPPSVLLIATPNRFFGLMHPRAAT
jgi:E2/UBC family protein A